MTVTFRLPPGARVGVGSGDAGLARAPHLHEDLEAVQRGCACPRHGARHRARHQLPPPRARQLLLLRELVGDGQGLADVQDLRTQGPGGHATAGAERCNSALNGGVSMNLRTPRQSTNESCLESPGDTWIPNGSPRNIHVSGLLHKIPWWPPLNLTEGFTT